MSEADPLSTRRSSKRLRFLAQESFLDSERAEEFYELLDDLAEDIRPRGIVEEIYVADIVCHVFEIMRLRRTRAETIRLAVSQASDTLIKAASDKTFAEIAHVLKDREQIRKSGLFILKDDERAQRKIERLIAKTERREEDLQREVKRIERQRERITLDWASNQKMAKEVERALHAFHMSINAIEAKATILTIPHLEALDRMIISLEERRDRALRNISRYRTDFARRLRDRTDEIIDAEIDEPPTKTEPGEPSAV